MVVDLDISQFVIWGAKLWSEQGPFELESWRNMMESRRIPPSLPFTTLWMAFRPGSVIYTRIDGTDKALRLETMERYECPEPFCNRSRWTITAEYIKFNGEKYSLQETSFDIKPY
ncbi:hypothetical protein B0J14DRAFT_667439 [Halenospora varia]|nr:hypothetical protein B0J14DRAFT_667439 [Halenospora varia]